MSQRLLWFFLGLAACGSAPSEPLGPDEPCFVAASMRADALGELAEAPACATDDDCVVIKTEIVCASVRLGDCGTVVHRAVESSLDWARVEREICRAVDGTDFGCTMSASCAQLGAPRCDRGACTH